MTTILKFKKFDETATFEVPTFAEESANPTIAPKGQQYIWNYGWKQSLQDAYAQSKNDAEFLGDVQKRYDAIVAGTIRIGSGRSPADPFEAECLRISRNVVTAAIKAKNLKVEKDMLVALVLKYRETNAEAIEAEATANLDKLKAASVGLDNMFESVLGEAPDVDAAEVDEEVTE